MAGLRASHLVGLWDSSVDMSVTMTVDLKAAAMVDKWAVLAVMMVAK